MIIIKDVHKSFTNNNVLQGVNMEIAKGESMVIIGGSGTGKSVLLKCILGLENPDSGKITLDGKETKKGDRNGKFKECNVLGSVDTDLVFSL